VVPVLKYVYVLQAEEDRIAAELKAKQEAEARAKAEAEAAAAKKVKPFACCGWILRRV
jgi:hypothetical protein